MLNFNQDYFSLFAIPKRYKQDISHLEETWRKLASKVHPDRYASAGETEKRIALMMATRINEAYQTLRSPLLRADYLLHLAEEGHRQKDTVMAMPLDFLEIQMEWRERIETARDNQDKATLHLLAQKVTDDIAQLERMISVALDEEEDYEAAAMLVQKWHFLEKLDQEIDNVLEALHDEENTHRVT